MPTNPMTPTDRARLTEEELDGLIPPRASSWWDRETKLGEVSGHREYGFVVDDDQLRALIAELREYRAREAESKARGARAVERFLQAVDAMEAYRPTAKSKPALRRKRRKNKLAKAKAK